MYNPTCRLQEINYYYYYYYYYYYPNMFHIQVPLPGMDLMAEEQLLSDQQFGHFTSRCSEICEKKEGT